MLQTVGVPAVDLLAANPALDLGTVTTVALAVLETASGELLADKIRLSA